MRRTIASILETMNRGESSRRKGLRALLEDLLRTGQLDTAEKRSK